MPKAIVTVALIKEDKTWDEERVVADGANLYNVFQNAEAKVRMKLDDLPQGVVAVTAVRAEWLDGGDIAEDDWQWMNGEIMSLPQELTDYREQHYKDVFKGWWERVARCSTNDEILVLRKDDKIVCGCVLQRSDYFVRFKDFVVLPGNRGKGYATKMMDKISVIAMEHHGTLMANGDKPTDINMMYLRSLTYLDGDGPGPEFEFGKFLKKMGFEPQKYSKHQLTPVEVEAMAAFKELYPESYDNIRVFTKMVVDNGVTLSPENRQELMMLTDEQKRATLAALEIKLGHYEKSGRVSYRYDLCAICNDMESDEQNSENCKKCYIHKTCLEPFREQGRFKEDFLIGAAYFNEMRRFVELRS